MGGRGGGHCVSKGMKMGSCRNVGDAGQRPAVPSLARAELEGPGEKFPEALKPGLV